MFSALYRVAAGAWTRLFTPWPLEWFPEASYGGLPNRQCLDAAWDVQGFLEENVALSQDDLVVLLGYWKFLDLFDYEMVLGFLCTVGFNPNLVELLVGHGRSLCRYFKVHGPYGRPIGQHKGLGQGDPFSVLVAMVYVGAQMRTVELQCPLVAATSVIDDRAIRGPPAAVCDAVALIANIDKEAGRITNVKKQPPPPPTTPPIMPKSARSTAPLSPSLIATS